MSSSHLDPVINAQSQGGTIVAAAIVFVAVSSSLVLLRFFTRSVILRSFGLEDWAIAFAQVLAIATSVCTVYQVKNGLGRHTWTVSADDSLRQLKYLYATILIYNPSQILLKISFLLQYRRIFTGERTWAVCFVMLIFVGIWGVAQEFLAGLTCIPLAVIAPNMTDHCITSLPVWYLTSGMNIATDFIIFTIPLPPLFKLQLGPRQKVLLVGLFSLGFFTCIISIIRLFTLKASNSSVDPMWDNSGTSYWSIIELNCGIICATLPTLRPLLKKLMPSYFATAISNHRSGEGKSGGSSPSYPGHHTNTGSNVYIHREVELVISSTTELNDDERYSPTNPHKNRNIIPSSWSNAAATAEQKGV